MAKLSKQLEHLNRNLRVDRVWPQVIEEGYVWKCCSDAVRDNNLAELDSAFQNLVDPNLSPTVLACHQSNGGSDPKCYLDAISRMVACAGVACCCQFVDGENLPELSTWVNRAFGTEGGLADGSWAGDVTPFQIIQRVAESLGDNVEPNLKSSCLDLCGQFLGRKASAINLTIPILLVKEGRGEVARLHLQRVENGAGHFYLAPEKSLIEVCLLYTSPSPRDGLLSRMPSSA